MGNIDDIRMISRQYLLTLRTFETRLILFILPAAKKLQKECLGQLLFSHAPFSHKHIGVSYGVGIDSTFQLILYQIVADYSVKSFHDLLFRFVLYKIA